jgi:hypothetical protein
MIWQHRQRISHNYEHDSTAILTQIGPLPFHTLLDNFNASEGSTYHHTKMYTYLFFSTLFNHTFLSEDEREVNRNLTINRKSNNVPKERTPYIYRME